ncbi:hypothetical protein [Bradyrhizobium huanghuaihaiense]|nr:hypothetical protein [Bradyrhizobium huanghuaihaiense]
MREASIERGSVGHWGYALLYLAGFAMIAGLIKFGADYYLLKQDFKAVQCSAAYWKAQALGHHPKPCPVSP